MSERYSPVPAVPTLVVALGEGLRERLAWLEARFRSEIGSLYPGHLLRFRLFTREADLSQEALRALCDPLLTHPLWLALAERGLAPGDEHGPQLNVYVLLSEEESQGYPLLGPLRANLARAYEGRLVPAVRVFYVGASPPSPAALAEGGRPVPCFLLGPVKQLGYGTGGPLEPYETIRLALNALLASDSTDVLDRLVGGAPGLVHLALGASAIAVARPRMESWVRSALLERLARACLSDDEASPRLETRRQVADLFGLEVAPGGADEPQELWEKSLGRRIAALFPAWANEALAAWGFEALETRYGHWRVSAQGEGELRRHLERILSDLREEQDDAQVALSQDLARLAGGLRRHFAERERVVLGRWRDLLSRAVGDGQGCTGRLAAIVRMAERELGQAQERLERQRLSPLWLRGDHDAVALAGILDAQMMPVRSAAERARQEFVPPLRAALRLVPFVLLVGAAGADLRPDGWGWTVGLGGGVAFGLAAMGLEYRRLARETRTGAREVLRLYEGAVTGLLLAEARTFLRHIREAVAISAAQLPAVIGELKAVEAEAGRVLAELGRGTRENTYLERQLFDPSQVAQLTEEIWPDLLAGGSPAGDPPMPRPTEILATALRGDLPARALGATLAGVAAQAVARHEHRLVEMRVEELLVAGVDQPFSPAETMEGLHRRALPLWRAEAGGPEVALAVLSREAAVALRGWLAAHAGTVHVLPTLQRDRISYLRLRRVLCTG